MTYSGFLDIQWGRFCASGKKRPIELIISTLKYGNYYGTIKRTDNKKNEELSNKEKDMILKEAIFNAAIWSLRSNCLHHPLVKQYCMEIYEEGKLNKASKHWLGALLAQVYPEKYKIKAD